MGFFDFLRKKQSKTDQAVSSEDAQQYLTMAVTFCSAYCLEMLAAAKCLKSEITLEEEGAIDLGGYLMFMDVFTSTDILTRIADNQREFSPDEVNAVAKETTCYSVCAGALQYATECLEQKQKSAQGLADKILDQEMHDYFSQVFQNCLDGFFAIASTLNPHYEIPNYNLLYNVVEGALARIYGQDFREGLTPFTLCHPMYSKYIQSYFYPCRVSEEEVLAFTYSVYRDLFGEVYGVMACARRKMAELFTADEDMSQIYRHGVLSSFLQMLQDRENEVFSMCLKDKDVPLSELNIGPKERKKILRIPAPSMEDIGDVAWQSFLEGFTGKK